MNTNSKKHRLAIFFLVIFVSFVMFTNVAVPKAQAQWAVLDAPVLAQLIGKGIETVYDKFIKQTIAMAFKEGLKMVLSKIAYDTATQIATGGRGQKASFWNQNWGDYLGGVGDAVLGQMLDDLSKEWGQFDICDPSSVNIKLGIHLSLFKERKPSEFGLNARCKFSEISQSWDTWANEVRNDPSKLYGDLRESFKPAENDAGMYLTLHSSLIKKEEENRLNAIIERSVNKGIKDNVSPIVKSIKTPALLLGEKFASVDKETGKVEYTYTGEIVDSFLGVFTNTLMAKWMDQLFNKGFNTAQELESQWDIPGGGGGGSGSLSSQKAVESPFAGLAEVNFTSSQQNIIDLLSQPSTNPGVNSVPGPTDEVITSSFSMAVRAKMTLKEAIESNPPLIDGVKPVGFLSNGSQPYYQDGYPYRSLVILRTQRIIPVGWELAAMYHKLYGGTDIINFNYLINCFEDPDDPTNVRKPDGTNPNHPYDCRENTNGNAIMPTEEDITENLPPDFIYDINPYFHLVDPNWVLKAPETICKRQGPGPEVVYDELQCIKDNVPNTEFIMGGSASGPYCESSSMLENNPDIPVRVVQRNSNYCGDWQSCILEAEDGSCQAYGYCVKEKPIWRFEGDSCPAYYSSCETFYNNEGGEFSYLRDTLLTCEPNEAGCTWYSIATLPSNIGELNWSPTQRIYLNQDAESCTYSNAGCTKLSSLRQGINTVFNGNFSEKDNDLFLGWEEEAGLISECVLTDSGNNEAEIEAVNFNGGDYCQMQSSGFIPVDTSFTYQFNYKIKATADVMSGVGLTFYDENFVLCDNNHPEPCRTSLGQELFDGVYSIDQDYIYYSFQIGPDSDTGDDFEPGTKYVKVIVKGPHSNGSLGTLWIDDIQFTVIKSPIVKHNQDYVKDPESYSLDYSQSSSYETYLKVPPEYLNCEVYNNFLYSYSSQTSCENANHFWRADIGSGVCVEGGSSYCDNYTNLCTAQDIGCNGYAPVNGGPEIPARITEADTCPAECTGYDSYLQQITYFDEIEEDPDPEPIYQNFIAQHPSTLYCPAQDAGCEQFTNMDEVAKGGEGIEYFTYLRQCISANNPDISAYFTWEGSDTTGYQLKKWTLLGSNYNDAPCTHIVLNQEGCQDNGVNYDDYVCDYPSDDLNCRDFFNAEGDHFAINQQYVITASGECHPYRRTKTGQIFNADPTEGISCPAASNNCKEYKGNAGNNIREIVNLDFEDTGGTPGGVVKTNGNTGGLTLSNEALYQGGHSLLVYVDNDTIVYPLPDDLTAGKQYQLSFWAKKSYIGGIKATTGIVKNFINRLAGLFGQSAIAQDSGNNSLEFVQDNLTTDWQLYTLGPIEPNALESEGQFSLEILNLDSDDGYYIDNIILLEYAENFYIIEDSWETPISCDQPYVGAQLGCSTYTDIDFNTEYLKTFDYICPSSSIGCEAFINTQNSTDLQGEQTWFGECNSYIGEIVDDKCYIRGIEMCDVVADDSCQYENIKVKNDEIIYAVNDPNKYCSPDEKGCSMVGWPELNRQNDYFAGGDLDEYYDNYIESYTTSYFINDPDKYSSQLCSESGLYCEMFSGDQELTAQAYFFNPTIGGLEGGNSNGRTCFYDKEAGNWKKSGTLEICSLSQFIPTNQDANYEGWVGLCEANYSTCTEYRDPGQPLVSKVAECDARISPQLSDICDEDKGDTYTDEIGGKRYCVKEINGVEHKVCTLYRPGAIPNNPPELCLDNEDCTPCPYTEHDWICSLAQDACDGEPDTCMGEYCSISGGAKDKQVCYVVKGQRFCNYSLACESYYYLHNTVEQCEGIIDSEAGCLLFNDTSNPELNFSSDISLDGQSPSSPAECSVAFYDDEEDLADCDSNTQSGIKVRKDRECAESLFCTSSVEIVDENNNKSLVCLSVGRCSTINPDNPANCLSISNATETEEQTYPVHDINYNSTGVEDIRNLSGLSKAGLEWFDSDLDEKDKIIHGNYPPEQMTQLGEIVTISNAGFESTGSEGIASWLENSSTNSTCTLSLDNNNPYSGTFSLSVSTPELFPVDYYCGARTENFYLVDSTQNYVVSFFANSISGGQRLSSLMQFYDSTQNWISNRVVVNEVMQPGWQYFSNLIGPEGLSIPDNAQYFKIQFGPGSSYFAQPNDLPGTIWFDEVKVAPALQISDDDRAIKECRLYPADDAPACEYTKSQMYHGWYGYCLEHDPNNPEACLQWFPIDNVAGESLSILGQAAVGYNGPTPLYYCLQSAGNYELGYPGDNIGGVGCFTHDYFVQSKIYVDKYPSSGAPSGSDCNSSSSGRDVCNSENGLYSAPCFGTEQCSNNVSSWQDKDEANFTWCIHSGANNQSGSISQANLPDLDRNLRYSDIENMYISVVVRGGGWCNPRPGWAEMDRTENGNDEVEYSYSCYSGGEGFDIHYYFSISNNSLTSVSWDADDNNTAGGAVVNIFYELRESCDYIAKVVKAVDETGVKEKAWFTRWNSDWTIEEGNIMGYDVFTQNYPYGAVLPSSEDEPTTWNFNAGNSPLEIYRGVSGNAGPSGGTPISVVDNRYSPGRMCVGGFNDGEYCISTTDEDLGCLGGTCMGVGAYCTNVDGYTNGVACDPSNIVCSNSYPNCVKSDLQENSPQTALNNRLLNLFSRSWGVWKWDDNEYKLCSPYSGWTIACGITNTSYVDDYGEPPVIDDILLNGKAENLILTAPGGAVELSFTTNVVDDQLPIDRIKIKWNDGPNNVQNITSSMYDKPSIYSPHKIFHTYSCVTNSEGNSCVYCWDEASDDWVESVDGSCRYDGPNITIQDHWEFCPATPNNGNDGWHGGENYICDVIVDGVQFQTSPGQTGYIYINPAY